MKISLIPYCLLLVCLCAYGTFYAHNKPIRAQIIMQPERDDKNHWRALLAHQKTLEQHGLTFVEKEPDVLLCNWVTKDLLQTNIPIIVLEINAAASLRNKTRKYLKYDQVKAVLKNRIFRDKTTYNQPHVQQTYFFSLVNQYAQLAQPTHYKPLSQHELDKIQLVVWDLQWSPFNTQKFSGLVAQKQKSSDERSYDLFFAGRLMCNGNSMLQTFYNWHRNKAFEALKNLHKYRCEIIEGRALPFDQYVQKLQTAKIVVSPWGWGEWCYRDFETILSGAVLIKPDTSFVLSYPDIYKNFETYVPCKPDFSDLEEKVQLVLDNFDQYSQLTQHAQKIIFDCWQQYNNLFATFVEALKRNLKEQP